MWQIFEHKRLDKQLELLPEAILKRYEKWKDIIAVSGPPGIRLIQGFRDKALKGQWTGFRSSRLGRKYRVIYQVVESRVLVKVIEVTPHDYRKK